MVINFCSRPQQEIRVVRMVHVVHMQYEVWRRHNDPYPYMQVNKDQ
jgi:hypothetical protein